MLYSLNDVQQIKIANLTTKTTLVADPGDGYKVVVLGYALTLDTAGEILFESATTALTGLIEIAADTPMVVQSVYGVLKCAPSELLALTSTTACNGWVRYVVIKA